MCRSGDWTWETNEGREKQRGECGEEGDEGLRDGGWRVAGDGIEEWGEMREDGAREQMRATGGKMCEEICGEEGWAEEEEAGTAWRQT